MSNLTISQALRRVKKLKGLISEHQQRAQQGVSYTSTKVPAFRFADEVAALKVAQSEMVDLEARVAVANAASTIQDGQESVTLAKSIRLLQELKGEIAFLKGLFLRDETVPTREMVWNEEKQLNVTMITQLVFVSDLSEKDRDQQVKDLQDRFEALNNLIENANHTVLV